MVSKFEIKGVLIALAFFLQGSGEIAGAAKLIGLWFAMATPVVAQAAGIDMPLSQQLLMMLTLMLTSKGVAAVPRASLVILSGALAQFGLPLEGIAVILGVDAIMDMARTSINLMGNCLATAVMARWEGELQQPAPEAAAA